LSGILIPLNRGVRSRSGAGYCFHVPLIPATRLRTRLRRVRSQSAVARRAKAIGDLGRNGDGGLVILPDVFNTTHRATIIADTAHHRVPAIYSLRFFVLAGGLISYGIDNIDVYRRAAAYVDRILNGAQPGELPVQLPSAFECAVNLTTLKALDLAVTPKLNVMANEMIE
jgi:putative ABC transport system substrate-binding protein